VTQKAGGAARLMRTQRPRAADVVFEPVSNTRSGVTGARIGEMLQSGVRAKAEGRLRGERKQSDEDVQESVVIGQLEAGDRADT
jgi:hypothetical protein